MSHATEVRRLRKVLKKVLEILLLSDPEGHRAAGIHAPEDPLILDLCERIGFGAVMDSAARQWRNSPAHDGIGAIGAHTTGACVGTLRSLVAEVRAALNPRQGK